MAIAELWAWEMLLAAFAGGALGASIGALQSFSLAGLFVIIGEVSVLLHRTIGPETGGISVDITGSIAFGVVLGPHIAFGGGTAATAYAAKCGYVDTDFQYHEAKNVIRGLGNRPDVLVVGGTFGIVGYVVASSASILSLPTDAVALGVVISAIVHRLAFGYDLIGASPSRVLDMSPFERGQRRKPARGRLTDGTGRSRRQTSNSSFYA